MKYIKLMALIAIIAIFSGCAPQQGGTSQQAATALPQTFPPATPVPTPTPQPTASPAPQPSPRLLASYSTKFTNKKQNRLKNIILAVNLINDYTIKDGGVFSFNQAVGPTTPERGFEEAVVYNNGEKDMDYGGGVCQVSSTLFNAAEKAGLTIIERHRHKGPIYYVPKGRDAAVSYGTIDLKIKNTLGFPVQIKASCSSGGIWVGIYEKR